MTNDNTYMSAAIENAVKRQAEIHANRDRIISGHASGVVDTPHGELRIDFVVAQGAQTYMPEHMRQTWKLNGKRIAAKKLEVLFD